VVYNVYVIDNSAGFCFPVKYNFRYPLLHIIPVLHTMSDLFSRSFKCPRQLLVPDCDMYDVSTLYMYNVTFVTSAEFMAH